MTITTNRVPRLLIDGYELTTREREEFDYLAWPDVAPSNGYRPSKDGEEATFFRYRGQLYDLGEFMLTDLEGWDGLQSDTFFSGVVVRFLPDDVDRVIVGRVYS